MKIKFQKFQGTGNDFIIINNMEMLFPSNNNQLIKKLCDRKFGIGADGLIIIRNHDKFDFEMFYFNSDGMQGSLCGNGSRCALAFGINNNLLKNKVVFKAIDGIHTAKAESNNIFSLSFKDVKTIKRDKNALFLDTGSPHYVELVESIDDINVRAKGSLIRNSNRYKNNGVNVNFFKIIGPDTIKIRTYERGVEDETLSCGTGAVASSIAFHFLGLTKFDKLKVETPGGTLAVEFKFNSGIYKDIYLKGPAEKVFSGKIKW